MLAFEQTTVEKDENGQLWVRDRNGNIACEAFYASEDESLDNMLDNGYICLPYLFQGERVYVQVLVY